MSDSENSVDITNLWCEQFKNDLEKMENEYNQMIEKFNKYIDNYSISTEYSKLNKVNQTFGEISQLIYVGRQMFYWADIGYVEYRKKFAERVFKIINISADIIKRVLNREEPVDSTYFFNEYENLKLLVYEIMNKRLAH
jgi:hypothetical protein